MLCKWCAETGKSNAFTQGRANNINIRLPGHKQAIQDLRQRENMEALCQQELDTNRNPS